MMRDQTAALPIDARDVPASTSLGKWSTTVPGTLVISNVRKKSAQDEMFDSLHGRPQGWGSLNCPETRINGRNGRPPDWPAHDLPFPLNMALAPVY